VRWGWLSLALALALGACARDNPLFGRQAGGEATSTSAGDSVGPISSGDETSKREETSDDAGTTGGPPPGDGETSTPGDSSGTDASADDNPTETGDACVLDVGMQCDAFLLNECPDGTRCRPVDTTEDFVPDDAYCVPIVDNPGQVGDECTRECGSDDCGAGLICGIALGPGEGVCVPLCSGPALDPVCDAVRGYTCMIPFGLGIYGVCAANCDPLLQDCASSQACVPSATGFGCVPDASDGESPGDPCEFLNQCGPGMTCASAAAVPGCQMGASAGCCTPFCEVGSGCAPGEVCTPVHPELPAFADIGVCLVDM